MCVYIPTLHAPSAACACYCLRVLLPWGHATLLQHSWTLQRREAPATLPDAATAASGATQRFCNVPGRCKCCLWSHAALLLRSCNAPKRCNCCFWGYATLQDPTQDPLRIPTQDPLRILPPLRTPTQNPHSGPLPRMPGPPLRTPARDIRTHTRDVRTPTQTRNDQECYW